MRDAAEGKSAAPSSGAQALTGGPGAGEKAPMRASPILLLGGILLLVPGSLRAAEDDAHGHASAPHKVIVIDAARVSPSALTMSPEDVLEFENFALNSMQVEFIEPADQAEKIRCHLVGGKSNHGARAAWQLFSWGPGHRLTATIPPGRFASVCSLAPGQYAFVARRAAPATGTPPAATLGIKGTITVQ